MKSTRSTTSRTRTVRGGAALLVVLGLVSCAGPGGSDIPGTDPASATSGLAVSPDGGGEGERTEVEEVERPVVPTVVYEGVPAEFDYPSVGESFYALWDPADVHHVRIYDRDTGEVVAEPAIPPDTYRYIGRVFFDGEDAIVVDSPAWDGLKTEPPARISRLDLTTGQSADIAPPEGQEWSFLAGTVGEWDGTVIAMTQQPPDQSVCAARIRGTTAELIHCWPQYQSDRMSLMPGHVSILAWPAGAVDKPCIVRRVVGYDGGGERQIGDPQACDRYDGITMDGWDIWSNNNTGVISESTLYADGPNGEHHQLGDNTMGTGGLTACGNAVYWIATTISNQDGIKDRLLRWVPGSSAIEVLYRPPERYVLRGPTCNQGVITTAETTTDAPDVADGRKTRILYIDTAPLG